MSYPYLLALAPGVVASPAGDGVVLESAAGRGLRLEVLDGAGRRLIERLAQAPCLAEDLAEADPARLHYLLLRLRGQGVLSYTVAAERWSASLVPSSPRFAFAEPTVEGPHRLSRFACLRRLGDEMAMECPLGHGRVLLDGGPALQMAGLLARPHSAPELAAAVGVAEDEARGVLALLVAAGAAFACDADGGLAEDRRDALRQWEFHDLLFHARSRLGRREPQHAPFRFKGEIAGLPSVKPSMSHRRIDFPTPDDGVAGSFQSLTDRRRSLREPGEAPITLEALGAFLHRSARIRQIQQLEDYGDYDVSFRPAASGGATHGLELYLTVHRAAGLEPGFYRYAPDDHVLERLAGLEGAPTAMLQMAAAGVGVAEPPDVLISLAARFARYSWKYPAIAYSLILKDAGALTQQMYLAATDLGLRPCGVGLGDSDLFAEAAGTDYYAETAVAEFILSGA